MLDEAVGQLGTQRAVADALGITTSRLGRIRKGEHSLDVLNCLKLARAMRRSPSSVLAAAGKKDVAEMIELLYGRDQGGLPADERELLHDWSLLDEQERRAFRLLISGRLANRKKKHA